MKRETRPEGGITRQTFVNLVIVVAASLALLNGTFTRAQQTGAPAGPGDRELIEDLVAANRILAQQGIVDGFGHVSARHNRDPNRYLLSRSLAPELVTADDIVEFDLDNRAVNAKGLSLYLTTRPFSCADMGPRWSVRPCR